MPSDALSKGYGDDLRVFVSFEKGGSTVLMARMDFFRAYPRVVPEHLRVGGLKRRKEIRTQGGKIGLWRHNVQGSSRGREF